MRARVAGLGGLLLSVLLVQARALPWPYNNVPSLDSLGGAICSLYGEDPLPFAANNFCNGTGFTKPDQSGYLCDILGYAEHALQAIASANASCPAAKQTRAATVSRNGVPIPYPLSDMRPLPVNLPASLLNTEGPSMYWHWKNLFNFEIWAPCAATNQSRTVTPGYVRMSNPALEWLRPVGWTVVSTQWVMDGPAQSGVYWPFATVLVNKGKHFKDSQLVKQGKHSTDSQLVIFIRGTETYLDWLTDFSYSETSSSYLKFPGKTHAGFTAIANKLWLEGLRDALYRNVVKGHIKSVAVTGHSLGAGVAQLVAYAAQVGV
eukprot:GHRQ01013082.1.p1 GENE.GHRQ01013082.1~~GHRQ01013082.1.p1  ORF type:complete len:319 (+),score=51.77 GHRQ01013082.1:1236-2192(+)